MQKGNKCNHKANLVGSLTKKITAHDRVKYSCKQCDHRANKEEVLFNNKGQYIKKESNTHAGRIFNCQAQQTNIKTTQIKLIPTKLPNSATYTADRSPF